MPAPKRIRWARLLAVATLVLALGLQALPLVVGAAGPGAGGGALPVQEPPPPPPAPAGLQDQGVPAASGGGELMVIDGPPGIDPEWDKSSLKFTGGWWECAEGGCLTVTKVVEPDDGQDWEFEICVAPVVTDNEASLEVVESAGDMCVTLTREFPSHTWTGLAPGEYRVIEVTPDDWLVSVDPDPVSVGDEGSTLVCATVENGAESEAMEGPSTWRLWYAESGSAKPASFDDPFIAEGEIPALDPGEAYTICVPVSASGNYHFGALQRPGHPGTGVLWQEVDDVATEECGEFVEPAAVTVTNEKPLLTPPGEIEVTKVVDWNGHTPFDRTFSICVEWVPEEAMLATAELPYKVCKVFDTADAASMTQTWGNLEPGRYLITEEDPGEDWDVDVDPEEVTLDPEDSLSAEVKVTNSYDPGDEPTPTPTPTETPVRGAEPTPTPEPEETPAPTETPVRGAEPTPTPEPEETPAPKPEDKKTAPQPTAEPPATVAEVVPVDLPVTGYADPVAAGGLPMALWGGGALAALALGLARRQRRR